MMSANRHRPCLALMGEFSAGKSTLANLLIGTDPLPVQVIATQLPPVCISYGDDAPYRVDLDGQKHPIDLLRLRDERFDDVAYLQIFCVEDILLQCDLLDMPGISDPNMASDVWERMIGKADGVLWCSHATQAWRQSEAAVWADMPVSLHERSLLLLTRIDKLQGARDRDRVLARVRKETAGLFRDVLPISLLTATQEQEDYALWSQSGAAEFAASLSALILDLQADLNLYPDEDVTALRLPGLEGPTETVMAPSSDPNRITPRRVVPKTAASLSARME